MISISGLELHPVLDGIQDGGAISQSYEGMTHAKRIVHFDAKNNLETGLRTRDLVYISDP